MMLTWHDRHLLIFQSIYDVISILDASFKLHPHEHASLRRQPAGQPLQILQRITWKSKQDVAGNCNMLQIVQRTVWKQTWDVVDATGNNRMETVVVCYRQQYPDGFDMLQILQIGQNNCNMVQTLQTITWRQLSCIHCKAMMVIHSDIIHRNMAASHVSQLHGLAR